MSSRNLNSPPELRYCQENVIAVFNQFEDARRLNSRKNGDWQMEALMNKYELLRTRQNCLSKMRNKDEENWGYIKPDLFNVLVQVLYEMGELKIQDDRLLLDAIPGNFYHSLNLFFNKGSKEYSIKSLAGMYRCYQPSTEYDNRILIGNCEISYEAHSNSLSVAMEQNFTPEDSYTRRHRFKGAIVRTGEKNFIWVDRDTHGNMQRLIKGVLAQNSPEEGGEEKIISLNGWCQYNFENRELVRRFYLERTDSKIASEYYPHTSAPKNLQPYLIRNSKNPVNVVEL